jgi:hypothetical protein
MATIDDVLDAFPEDLEPGSPSVETAPPTGVGGGDCLLAVKAAMETISEFCDPGGFPVTLAGITVHVPTGVLRIAQMDRELPREDRIVAIRESTWMLDLSNGLCAELRGLAAGTPENAACAAALGKRMTEELVK